MQVDRTNYKQYQQLIAQMMRDHKGGAIDPYGTVWGAYELRHKPTDRPFTPPDWSDIRTKRDKPYMTEAGFDEAIKDLARKEYITGKRDRKSYQFLIRRYGENVSPDRKGFYEKSMQKTGGKMNAACMFFDDSGFMSLAYHPSGEWMAYTTKEESERSVEFTSIYNTELKRLIQEYGPVKTGAIKHNLTLDSIKGKTNIKQNGIGENIDFKI